MAPAAQFRRLDGTTFALSDYRGKFVILDFMGLHCPPCMRLHPKLRALESAVRGSDVVLLGALCYAPFDLAVKWAGMHKGPEFRDLVVDPAKPDKTQTAAWKFGNVGTPTVVLIDRTGKIVGDPIQDEDTAVPIFALRLRSLGVQIDEAKYPIQADFPTIPPGSRLQDYTIRSLSTQKVRKIAGPAIVTFWSPNNPDSERAVRIGREAAKKGPVKLGFFAVMIGDGDKPAASREKDVFASNGRPREDLNFSTPCTVLVNGSGAVVTSADPLNFDDVVRAAKTLGH
jgi:thiol-disulfide isomerase/thioredoxin